MAERVVIVTGASRGIGLEVCRRFAAAGDRVGMIARDRAELAAAAARLGGTTHVAAADVADPDAVAAAVAVIEAALGPPAVLVNNAGHGQWGAVVDTPPEEFRRAIDVNYLGAVHAAAAVLPGMLERGHGCIVNVSSIAGRIGAPFEAAYSASKFALAGYSEALQVELAGTGVHVTLVDPGPVATSFHERRGHAYDRRWPRPVSAERVAAAVVRAARGGDGERFLPRWLRVAHVVKAVCPPLARRGAARSFAAERRAWRSRAADR